jgi:proteic killer suppression protein
MEVEFADDLLGRLERELQFTAGFTAATVKGFRKRMQLIRAAMDERDLYMMKGAHFEKLKGARSHQRSMKCDSQWRLILELHQKGSEKVVRIIAIEDYH